MNATPLKMQWCYGGLSGLNKEKTQACRKAVLTIWFA